MQKKKTNLQNFLDLIKRRRFEIVGVLFLILQIVVLYKFTFLSHPSNLLWFCSHAPLLFGIFFIKKNFDAIKAVICVGLIPQLIWLVDFLGKTLFGEFIFGVSDYMFLDILRFSYITGIFEHFFSSLLALILVYKYKPRKKVLIYATIYLALILIFTVSFSEPEQNFNLTKHMMLFDEFTFPGYTYAWMILAFIIVVIPTYYLQVFLYKLSQRKSIRRKNL